MKNKKQIIFYGMIALLFMQIPMLKADSETKIKREFQLTTYYPAPHGDYKNINTTEDARLATSSGNVGIGTTSPDKDAKLEVNNTLRLTPVTGDAAAQRGGQRAPFGIVRTQTVKMLVDCFIEMPVAGCPWRVVVAREGLRLSRILFLLVAVNAVFQLIAELATN